MKVIKSGKRPEDKKHRWTCTNCGAVVEAAKKEGKEVCDARGECSVIFKCPECGDENWIDTDLFK